MSIAYPIISISITHVFALESHRVRVGSVWTTGNLLYRAQVCGSGLLGSMKQWARGEDGRGRGYVLYRADHPRAGGLVIQALDSCYCFEVFPSGLQPGPKGDAPHGPSPSAIPLNSRVLQSQG